MKKIPFMLIVGEKEAENNEVSVRQRTEGDKGSMGIEKFTELVQKTIEDELSSNV
jgi:threonyl-tRNA synthetase